MLNKTFYEAVEYAVAEIAAARSAEQVVGYVYMLVYYFA